MEAKRKHKSPQDGLQQAKDYAQLLGLKFAYSTNGKTIRDYARDRVLLRAGVPTVRFTAQDCLLRPEDVVAEVLAILKHKG